MGTQIIPKSRELAAWSSKDSLKELLSQFRECQNHMFMDVVAPAGSTCYLYPLTLVVRASGQVYVKTIWLTGPPNPIGLGLTFAGAPSECLRSCRWSCKAS